MMRMPLALRAPHTSSKVRRALAAPLRAALCLALALSTLPAMPSQALAVTSPPPPPRSIVVLGDSVANGMGLANPFIDSWPRRLARLGGITVYNRSVGGDTTAKMMARFDADVVSLHPDAVVICIGLNDLRRDIPEDVLHGNIRWMAERARSFGIRPFIGTLPPLASRWPALEAYDDWIREYATQTPGVALVDFYSASEYPAGSGKTPFIVPGDWCHPSANGHWLMTLPALSAIVAGGTRRPTTATLAAPAGLSFVPGATYLLTGRLQADRVGLPGHRVILQSATPGQPFSDVVSVTDTSAVTVANGTFSIRVRPSSATQYRVRFDGSALYAPSKPSLAVQLAPTLWLGTPIAPAEMRVGVAATVSGFMKPRHAAGTYPVEINLYHWEWGNWVRYGKVSARASDYSTYTKYSASVRLSKPGRWRLRAYAPADGKHFALWTRGFAYVDVK